MFSGLLISCYSVIKTWSIWCHHLFELTLALLWNNRWVMNKCLWNFIAEITVFSFIELKNIIEILIKETGIWTLIIVVYLKQKRKLGEHSWTVIFVWLCVGLFSTFFLVFSQLFVCSFCLKLKAFWTELPRCIEVLHNLLRFCISAFFYVILKQNWNLQTWNGQICL